MRKPIRTSKGLEKVIWEKILEEFSKAKSIKELDQLFGTFLTNQEREGIARRLATLSLVRKGHSYRSIGEKLWVSPITISTIKKTIFTNRGYKSYYELTRDRKGNNTSVVNTENKKSESIFSEWLDHIAFMIENAPQKSGPRWRFLDYNPTLPKKSRQGGNTRKQ